MSEQIPPLSDEDRIAKLKKSYWYWYDAKTCMVQLDGEWMAVQPNMEMVTRQDDQGNVVGAVVLPALKCRVHVRPDFGPNGTEDVMFLLEAALEPARPNDRWIIGVPRVGVRNITVVNASMIQT